MHKTKTGEIMTALPKLSFSEAIKLAFSKLLVISGRSRRSEFWWFFLFGFLINLAALLISKAVGIEAIAETSQCIVNLLITPLGIRRLHDTGHSALLLLLILPVLFLSFVPLSEDSPLTIFIGLYALAALGIMIAIIIFWAKDGSPEENKYGPSPKYVNE